MSDDAVRLLLVEDDPELARAVARALRRDGLEVTAAPSCATARALTCPFDVGVFDIGLPDGDGVQLAQQFLDTERVGRAVFFSGVTKNSVVARALRLGPVVRKREGVEGIVQVVLGVLGRGPVTHSGFRTVPPQPGAVHVAKKKTAG